MPLQGYEKISKILKSLFTALILSTPLSYMLLTFYADLGIGRWGEGAFATVALSALLGFVLWDEYSMVYVILTSFLSVIFALALGSFILAYPLIISSLFYEIIVFVFMKKVLLISLFCILPLILLFMFIGSLLSEASI